MVKSSFAITPDIEMRGDNVDVGVGLLVKERIF